jgi:Tfp pilus assembly protein PilF
VSQWICGGAAAAARRSSLWGLVLVLGCGAQENTKTVDEVEADLAASLRGDSADSRSAQSPDRAFEQPSAIEFRLGKRGTNQPPAGITSVEQLRHKIPADARKHFARGLQHARKGEHQQAASELEKAVARDSEFGDARRVLGVEFAELGRFREANENLRMAVTLDSASWRAHHDLGVLQLRVGDTPAAEWSARRALELSPGNAQVHLLLGWVLVQRDGTKLEGLQHITMAARTLPAGKGALKILETR